MGSDAARVPPALHHPSEVEPFDDSPISGTQTAVEQRRSRAWLPEQMRANKSLACVHNYSNVVVDPMMTLQKVIHEQGHSADTYCSFMLVLELFNKIAGNF